MVALKTNRRGTVGPAAGLACCTMVVLLCAACWSGITSGLTKVLLACYFVVCGAWVQLVIGAAV